MLWLYQSCLVLDTPSCNILPQTGADHQLLLIYLCGEVCCFFHTVALILCKYLAGGIFVELVTYSAACAVHSSVKVLSGAVVFMTHHIPRSDPGMF